MGEMLFDRRKGRGLLSDPYVVDDILADAALWRPIEEKSAELCPIIRRCIQKSPDQRFQSAIELQEALKKIKQSPGRPGSLGSLGEEGITVDLQPSSPNLDESEPAMATMVPDTSASLVGLTNLRRPVDRYIGR